MPGTEGAGRPHGRLAAVLLAVLVAASLLTGCGSDSGAGPGAGAAHGSAAAGPSAGTTTAGSATPRSLARSVPVRLEIPGIGVDTPVIRLGLAADGSVQVPPIEKNSPAGWYQGSPTPGQIGPSVILAHVTPPMPCTGTSATPHCG